MVFENLTLFELHLENARFGPSVGGEAEEAYEAEAEGAGGGGMGRALGVLLLFVALAMAARRYRSRGEAEEIVEEESEQITIEHATE